MNSPFAVRAGLMALLLAAGCSRGADRAGAPSPGSPQGDRVTVDSAQRSRFEVARVDSSLYRPSILTTGTVAFSPDRSTQLLAPVSGPVLRILANPGERVVPGQALATVASPDFAAAVAAWRKADALWHNAQRIAAQDEQLFANDALARRDLDQARTDLAGAGADRDAARQQLASLGVDAKTLDALAEGKTALPAEAVIRAPIAGTLVEKLITAGQLLQAGATPCFTIADFSTVWVMASVFEKDIREVAIGERATVRTDASPAVLPGSVQYVAALVDPATRATQVRLVVPNPGGVLKRDMLVQVTIEAKVARRGLLVPVTAVLRDDDNLPFLFLAMADGSFGRRRIELGGRTGDRYEITSGLAAGERVVVNGSLYLATMVQQ
jgi:membrane fusion protein, heavy metal efflux system